jgi:hypothetical protein
MQEFGIPRMKGADGASASLKQVVDLTAAYEQDIESEPVDKEAARAFTKHLLECTIGHDEQDIQIGRASGQTFRM